MTTTRIPDDVRRYIVAAIPSVPYLEALLLLRADPGRPWQPAGVASRLYVTEPDAAALLRSPPTRAARPRPLRGWSYAPSDAELRDLIDRVAAAYAAHLVPVTDMIHARPGRRDRQFADAFR